MVPAKAILSRNSSLSGRTQQICGLSAWLREQKDGLLSLYSQTWKTVTLLGHATLHIRYDLPVVIATSLKGDNEYERLVRAERYEEVFTLLEKTFNTVIDKPWDKPLLVEVLGWQPAEFDNMILTWLVSQRRDAWLQAKTTGESKYS